MICKNNESLLLLHCEKAIITDNGDKICLRSSMDRILDSGSNDWGSTPHGDTRRLNRPPFLCPGSKNHMDQKRLYIDISEVMHLYNTSTLINFVQS